MRVNPLIKGFGLEFLGKAWDNLGDGKLKEHVPRVMPSGRDSTPADRSKVDYGDMTTYGKQMQTWHEVWARNVLRVLKPGAYLLAFSGTRTVHRLGCALEDAGFEVRDMIVWIHSQGFPKGINPSKAFDREAGVEPEVIGYKEAGLGQSDSYAFMQSGVTGEIDRRVAITAPTTEEAKKWAGWGTHLSPAFEPIVVARKPLEGTVIENLRKWGVGAINIDATRFGGPSPSVDIWQGGSPPPAERDAGFRAQSRGEFKPGELLGRYPKNLILSHSPECVKVGEELVKETSDNRVRAPWFAFNELTQDRGELHPSVVKGIPDQTLDVYRCAPGCPVAELASQMQDNPSRFFYTPKPSRNEREFGLGAPLSCLRCSYEQREGKVHAKHEHIYNEHACLHPSALVLTEHGFRPIKEVTVGSKVYSEDGKFSPVAAKTKHSYNSHLYEIGVNGFNLKTKASNNHPFLIWRPTKYFNWIKGGDVGWVDAENLVVGDYTMTPIVATPPVLDSEHEDFWWAAGLWVAEGTLLNEKYPLFSLHKKETKFVSRLRRAFPNKRVSMYKDKHSNGMRVVLFDAEFGKFLLEMFGKGASKKYLSTKIFDAGKAARRAFLMGYLDGDGCKVRGYRVASTVSFDLAALLKLLGESVGYGVSIQKRPPTKGQGIGSRKFKTTRPFYQLFFYARVERTRKPPRPRFVEHNGRIYSLQRIKQIRKVRYRGYVLNLTVEGSPTFQTAVGMSHNTVKAIALMRYLIKLATPPGGTILDPFMGSGTTLIAAREENVNAIGIEREASYAEIARRRIAVLPQEAEGFF